MKTKLDSNLNEPSLNLQMLIESSLVESEEQFRAFLLATLTAIYGRLPEWLEFQIGPRFEFSGKHFREFVCSAGSVAAQIRLQAGRAGGLPRAIIERGAVHSQPVCFEISNGVETQIDCAEVLPCLSASAGKVPGRDYWEQRYQTNDMPWEKGAAAPGLVDFLTANPNLKRSTVCVPGCGTGHDAREFARAGFMTFGFDLAPSAIQLATEKTSAAGLAAQFHLGDFLRDEPPQQFDWLFEHTLFCAIQPAERDAYVRAASRWLKPGGDYLAVNYLIPDTDGPPFGTTREEILERFSPYFELKSEWVPRSYPNRTNLERMFWWSLRTAKAAA